MLIHTPHLPSQHLSNKEREFPEKPDDHMVLLSHTSKEAMSGLAFLPLLAIVMFYLLPDSWQADWVYQFMPQIISYMSFGIWAYYNTEVIPKLGMQITRIRSGIRLGIFIGLLLGGFNTILILFGAPALGLDILFLKNTPHAHIPLSIMVPWFILFIAVAVEINFRGFLLGRLLALFSQNTSPSRDFTIIASGMALGISSLAFAFDPFMVSTFQHLHWIAVWDGFIWGWVWLQTRNLYIPMTAHFMEVLIEYLVIHTVLA